VRDLSLHLLDLLENSMKAGATVVAVTVAERPEADRLRLVVEDNGPGLGVPPAAATDPFYTTGLGKRTGLGLSPFHAAAEQAGGSLSLILAKVRNTPKLLHKFDASACTAVCWVLTTRPRVKFCELPLRCIPNLRDYTSRSPSRRTS